MRLWGAKRRDPLEFTVAARPPLEVAVLVVVLLLAAFLVVAGFDAVYAAVVFLVAEVVGLAAMWALVKLRGRSLQVFDSPDGRQVRVKDGLDTQELRLNELATVSREQEGESPRLTLTDLRGASVTIPLGTWFEEARLLEEIEAAAQEVGAAGSVGEAVSVVVPTWVAASQVAALVALLTLPLVVVGLEVLLAEPAVERVTPERIEETKGETATPFAGSNACAVYVVPLDRPSEERANDLARALTRFPVLPCAMPSLALDTSGLDSERGQLDASGLAVELYDQFFRVWKYRPSTILGVTEHDVYSSSDPSLRFVFGTSHGNGALQGFGVISTARMGSGDELERRLETMAVRHLGLRFFGLEVSEEERSALYHTIAGRGDLDRMRPQLGDPPLSQLELREARARFLARL